MQKHSNLVKSHANAHNKVEIQSVFIYLARDVDLTPSPSALAQKMKLIFGDLKDLKDVPSFDIKFVYDSMTVGINLSEKEYLKTLSDRWEAR